MEPQPTPKRLMDQVRDALLLKHSSYRTEQAYVGWITRYVLYHGKRHPNEMGAPEVEAFLTHLAVEEDVDASTQNQAFCALLFLYREVLHEDPRPVDALRAKRPRRPKHLPTVVTQDETGCLLCTAAACASWNAGGCASRISSSSAEPLSSVAVRGSRTV